AGVVPHSLPAIDSAVSIVAWGYVIGCIFVLSVAMVQRWRWRHHPERRGALLANHTWNIRTPRRGKRLTAPGIPTWLSCLPGNEVLSVCVQEKRIAIPRLAQSQELRIVHLSD